MPRIEMLQAGLIWAEKELNGWATSKGKVKSAT